ncbi:hypothetical protein HNY73_000929 [Argiope bruennichi]|uniref:Gustatory receptor n=1 Tax=Argiope bruennichi TaxID=94029 RepID=A0A8T0G3Y2_ARGBR|nr:hypothetical protein HNY73_000929 [Argiope bruennichi]
MKLSGKFGQREKLLESSFKTIFFIYGIFGVHMLDSKNKRIYVLKCLHVGIFILTVVYRDFIGIIFQYLTNRTTVKIYLISLTYKFLEVTVLVLVLFKRKEFSEIAGKVTNFCTRMQPSEAESKTLINKARATCYKLLFIHVVMCVSAYLRYIADKNDVVFLLRGHTLNLFDDTFLLNHQIAIFTISVILCIFWNLASMLYTAFYSVTCHALCSAIDAFKEKLLLAKPEEFEDIAILANHVETMVKFVDRKLSLVTFFTFLNTFGIITASATDLARSHKYTAYGHSFRFAYFGYNFYLFLRLVLVAAKVNEAGKEVQILSHNIPWNQPEYEKERFILVSRLKSLNTTLTLWNIGELKKQFLLSSCSALLSYFVLLSSI